jgi:triacylglycerol lipase
MTLILDGIWGRPWRFKRFERELAERCGPAQAYAYNSSGAVSLDELGATLATWVRKRGEAINVIGHSMGGLVVRAAHLADPRIAFHRTVFVHTPHHGSWLAYALPLKALRQMRPGSDFLRRLDQAPWPFPTLAVWCPGDAMILPGSSAKWDKAQETICCRVPAHSWPIWSGSFRRRIVDFLAAPDGAANSSPLSPVPGGEGRGEGPVDGDFSPRARSLVDSAPHPSLSPAYKGEGK